MQAPRCCLLSLPLRCLSGRGNFGLAFVSSGSLDSSAHPSHCHVLQMHLHITYLTGSRSSEYVTQVLGTGHTLMMNRLILRSPGLLLLVTRSPLARIYANDHLGKGAFYIAYTRLLVPTRWSTYSIRRRSCGSKSTDIGADASNCAFIAVDFIISTNRICGILKRIMRSFPIRSVASRRIARKNDLSPETFVVLELNLLTTREETALLTYQP
jgi:hypothetical protein